MSKSIEDLILSEVKKQRANDLPAKLAYFNQLCERLGLQKERLSEISQRVEELFKEELNDKNIH